MATHTSHPVAPDIKKPFDATVPSLPLAAAILPGLLYLWMLYGAFAVGMNIFEVQMMKRDYPAHVAEKQQLDSRISSYKEVVGAADSQFTLFRLWKGWLLESPPLTKLISLMLNSIQSDVRITTLQLNKEQDTPGQLEVTLRLALTNTDPSRQFDMVLQTLEKSGWRIGGSVNQAVDTEAERLFPTPSGAPREVFYKLESSLNERIDLDNPNVPFAEVIAATPAETVETPTTTK